MTNFSPTYRFWEGIQNDAAIANAWGTPNSENMELVEAALGGGGGGGPPQINLSGLSSYSLTTANGATDQARPLLQTYVGALVSQCFVTVPNKLRLMGMAQNLTTGAFPLTLTAGGTTITVPQDGLLYWYTCDGNGNLSFVPIGFAQGQVGGQPVVAAQFAQSLGANGFVTLPGGRIEQWGGGVTSGGTGAGTVSFPIAFPQNVFRIVVSPTGATQATSLSLAVANKNKGAFTVFAALSGNVATAAAFEFIAIGN